MKLVVGIRKFILVNLRTVALIFPLAMAFVGILSGCNSERNYDESERERRLFYPRDRGGYNGEPIGGAPLERNTVDSFYFRNIVQKNSLIQINFAADFWNTERTNLTFFHQGKIFVDPFTQQVFASSKTSSSQLEKLGVVDCKIYEGPCFDFTFTTDLRSVFAYVPSDVENAKMILDYSKLAAEFELRDLSEPNKLVSKVDAVRLSSNFFSKSPQLKLFPTSSGASNVFQDIYYNSDNVYYTMTYPVPTPPVMDGISLVFDTCTQSPGENSVIIRCTFINPSTREIVTTKQALIHVKKN